MISEVNYDILPCNHKMAYNMERGLAIAHKVEPERPSKIMILAINSITDLTVEMPRNTEPAFRMAFKLALNIEAAFR